MFFQELLALGERIGHVSTGLSEEKIMSGLKQWKYLIPLEEPPTTGVEPCCICQVTKNICFIMVKAHCYRELLFEIACLVTEYTMAAFAGGLRRRRGHGQSGVRALLPHRVHQAMAGHQEHVPNL